MTTYARKDARRLFDHSGASVDAHRRGCSTSGEGTRRGLHDCDTGGLHVLAPCQEKPQATVGVTILKTFSC